MSMVHPIFVWTKLVHWELRGEFVIKLPVVPMDVNPCVVDEVMTLIRRWSVKGVDVDSIGVVMSNVILVKLKRRFKRVNDEEKKRK